MNMVRWYLMPLCRRTRGKLIKCPLRIGANFLFARTDPLKKMTDHPRFFTILKKPGAAVIFKK
jgi:hypothetical protein